MKLALRIVTFFAIGVIVIFVILVAIGRQSNLPKHALFLILVYLLVAVFVPRVRNYFLTTVLRNVATSTAVASVLLFLLSSFASIHVLVSSNTCIGLEEFAVRYSWDDRGKHGPDAKLLELSFHWPKQPTRLLLNQSAWGAIALDSWTQFMFPTWVLPPILLIVAFFFWAVHAKRKETGLCENCAYDLTGNTFGVCPECGTRIES